MDNEIDIFERFFRAQVIALPEVAACVGEKVCNQMAPPKTPFPYAIFTVIPLDDVKGQAGTSILTRVLIDLKFVAKLPMPNTVGPAIAAVKEIFRTSGTFDSENCRISIWHKTPINRQTPGSVPGEDIFARGGTFQATIARVTAD